MDQERRLETVNNVEKNERKRIDFQKEKPWRYLLRSPGRRCDMYPRPEHPPASRGPPRAAVPAVCSCLGSALFYILRCVSFFHKVL